MAENENNMENNHQPLNNPDVVSDPQESLPPKPEYAPTVHQNSTVGVPNSNDVSQEAPNQNDVNKPEIEEDGIIIPPKPDYPPTVHNPFTQEKKEDNSIDSTIAETNNPFNNDSANNDPSEQYLSDRTAENNNSNMNDNPYMNGVYDSYNDNNDSENSSNVGQSQNYSPYAPPTSDSTYEQQQSSQNQFTNDYENSLNNNGYGYDGYGNTGGTDNSQSYQQEHQQAPIYANSGYTQQQSAPNSQFSFGNYYEPNLYGNGDDAPLNQPLYGATFMQATKRFFKKYAKFSGYASRSEYWFSYLFLTLVSIIPTIFIFVGMMMMGYTSAQYASSYSSGSSMSSGSAGGAIILILAGIVMFLFWAATIVPSLAITWRRLHDAGFSGLFFFLSLIPYVGGLILLVFTVLPTKPEARRLEWEDRG